MKKAVRKRIMETLLASIVLMSPATLNDDLSRKAENSTMISSGTSHQAYTRVENLGDHSKKELTQLIKDSHRIGNAGKRIVFIAEYFLGTPYKANSLGGGLSLDEKLTIDLAGMDCITSTEYFLAMANSKSYESFVLNLKQIRYSGGGVSFTKRNHYSLDWIANNQFTDDVTGQFPHRTYSKVVDYLETEGILANDGLSMLRQITHVPRASAGKAYEILKTGDIIFFTTTKPHLDVAHVGIVLQGNPPDLIHANSVAGKFMMQGLPGYFEKMKSYSGFIVARPK